MLSMHEPDLSLLTVPRIPSACNLDHHSIFVTCPKSSPNYVSNLHFQIWFSYITLHESSLVFCVKKWYIYFIKANYDRIQVFGFI